MHGQLVTDKFTEKTLSTGFNQSLKVTSRFNLASIFSNFSILCSKGASLPTIVVMIKNLYILN